MESGKEKKTHLSNHLRKINNNHLNKLNIEFHLNLESIQHYNHMLKSKSFLNKLHSNNYKRLYVPTAITHQDPEQWKYLMQGESV